MEVTRRSTYGNERGNGTLPAVRRRRYRGSDRNRGVASGRGTGHPPIHHRAVAARLRGAGTPPTGHATCARPDLVVMEATGSSWWSLATALADAGFAVSV